ncbi:hypothetical protein POPTR_011G162912v4 [Populus trichocarpa]|uniref:Uncharacterized protein n=1 Tax=Populus trichocarpa TaxID=3694 RepID=A0ACC0SA85_POPTR|nr:hypothetical protein POPTR_011G162912v4 [Populus trichocarpa]
MADLVAGRASSSPPLQWLAMTLAHSGFGQKTEALWGAGLWQRGKKKPKGKLGERGAAACVKENGVGAAAGKMNGLFCCWLAKEKKMGEPTGK